VLIATTSLVLSLATTWTVLIMLVATHTDLELTAVQKMFSEQPSTHLLQAAAVHIPTVHHQVTSELKRDGRSTDTFIASTGLMSSRVWSNPDRFNQGMCDRQTVYASALWHFCSGIWILFAGSGTCIESDQVLEQFVHLVFQTNCTFYQSDLQ